MMTPPPRGQRRALGLWIAALILVASGAALAVVDRVLDRRATEAQTMQRLHVEQVTSIRRTVRSTYVALLERWLVPHRERTERSRDIETSVEAVRDGVVRFDELPIVAPGEEELRLRLRRDVALWSNRAILAVVDANGPSSIPELRSRLDAIDASTDALLEIDTRATETRGSEISNIRRQRGQVQVMSAFITALAIALSYAWWRSTQGFERRLRASEAARAVEEQRAAIRARFFASMSHELRTPLVAIKGFAALLEEDDGDDEVTRRDFSRRITHEANELLAHVNNVLDAAKLEAGSVVVEVEEVDLEASAARCIRRCQGLVGDKPVKLVLDLPPTLPRLRTDALKVQQVLTNLLANALKFTDRGSVTLRARATPDGGAVFEVEDTGIGIDVPVERLFEPFEQADGTIARRFGGTGLGLSIVRTLVQLLGGTVAVRSTVGVGSTFTVTLPASVGARESQAA